jgi:hypothetical protein
VASQAADPTWLRLFDGAEASDNRAVSFVSHSVNGRSLMLFKTGAQLVRTAQRQSL